MADYTFAPAAVLVEGTGEFAIGALGVLRATEGGDPVPIFDLNDSPLPGVVVGPKGAHQAFKADISDGVLDFDSVLLPTISLEAQRAGLTAVATSEEAMASAAEALSKSTNALNLVSGTANFLVHGDDANFPRGTVNPVPIVWFGSVEPVNADPDTDIYIRVNSGT